MSVIYKGVKFQDISEEFVVKEFKGSRMGHSVKVSPWCVWSISATMRLLAEFQIDLLNEMGDKIFQTKSDDWIDFSRLK